MNNYQNTIAAISTPPGKGGVAIIRISGTDAVKIAAEVFFPVSKKSFADATPRMQIYGNVVHGECVIDDGMATYFKAPSSYTGEDVVEISCHGGILVTEAVLEALFAHGATPARAGEFTERAFLAGKLSLTEAEAVGNLLEAESREQIKLASAKSRSKLTDKIASMKKTLTSILSSTFARIDYPDEDLGDFSDGEALKMLGEVKISAEALLDTYDTAKAVCEGVKTVICGKPNVGKSSIYNLLVGRDAAIVTDVEGTTRDVLTERIQLGKIMLQLSDTAGLRDGRTSDVVEKIGMERTRRAISDCELILAVFDRSAELDGEDKELISLICTSSAAKIAILNKSDGEARLCTDEISGFDSLLEISALKDGNEAKRKLSEIVNKLFVDEKISLGNEAVIFSARQRASLEKAIRLIDSAIAAIRLGMPEDATASDVEAALAALGELDGRSVTEEIVADIFSKFCVGK
ncbi:MAG: tRNA uridine-5-carboxymethylaminomethyl(34) synthesis GTPase MnmE [Clostridia bacterium]|nr:tRNA uridine-5-carboxymethylaminomethyl(34) synthesis GTPase MnmE [Clostridia bacterium]